MTWYGAVTQKDKLTKKIKDILYIVTVHHVY